MKARIQKWGNSLALRIPKSFAEETQIEHDTLVELSLEGGKLVVSPIPQPRVTLEQLLANITGQNLHQEVDTGQSVGGEAW
jgi:antitoxin MazE